MKAVKFDWLNQIDIDLGKATLFVDLKNGEESINAWTNEIESKMVSREVNKTIDPQNSEDIEVEVKQLKQDAVFFVEDWDNVHAVDGMPFKLTSSQFNTVNSYLEDI